MTDRLMSTVEMLNAAISILNEIENEYIVNGVSSHFLEILSGRDEEEIRIQGNLPGLTFFAKNVLEVAASQMSGVHRHFDEAGIVDRCDMPVVVLYKEPEWQKETVGLE